MNYSSIFYLVLVVIIGLVLPTLGVINGRKSMDWLITSPEMRASFYRQTVVTLLVLAGLVLLAMFINEDSISNIGMGFLFQPTPAIILVVSCLAFLVLLNVVPNSGFLIKVKNQYRQVMFLLPSTKHQYSWSIVLSFTAGFCEEIIYRGFLFQQVSTYLPEIPSVLLVNVIFALCHWGSGIKNATWSFGLGVFWSITYLWTGSLWLAVLTHVLIDLMSMTLGYKIKQLNNSTSTPSAEPPFESAS